LNDYDEQPPAALRSPSGQRHHPASVGDPIGLVEPLPGRTGPGSRAVAELLLCLHTGSRPTDADPAHRRRGPRRQPGTGGLPDTRDRHDGVLTTATTAIPGLRRATATVWVLV